MAPLNKDDVCLVLAASLFPVRRDLLVICFSAFQSPRSNYNSTNRLPKGLANP